MDSLGPQEQQPLVSDTKAGPNADDIKNRPIGTDGQRTIKKEDGEDLPSVKTGKKEHPDRDVSLRKRSISHSEGEPLLQQNGAAATKTDKNYISTRSHRLNKVLIQIKKGLKRIKPEKLIKIYKELALLPKTRTYGDRYEGKGIPESEVKLYKDPKILLLRGMTVNPFYHACMVFGDPALDEARFVQINDTNNYPEFMTREQFFKYMDKEGGNIVGVWEPKEDRNKMAGIIKKDSLVKLAEQEAKVPQKKKK